MNENPNQNPNQVPGDGQGNDQEQNPPPHNPFLPNAPLVTGAPQRPQLIGPILSLSLQVNQKMQKPIYLGQMIGCTHRSFQIM